MKKIFMLFAALAGAACLAPASQAQTITSANYYDSCYFSGANTLQGVVNLTSPTSLLTCKVETNYGDGSRLDTTAIGAGSVSGVFFSYMQQHSYTTVGSYTVKHVLICGSTRLDSLSQSTTVACRYIGGALYNDANSNCVYNSTENMISGSAAIEIDSAGTKVDTVYGGGYWRYRVRATATTVYKFRLLSTPGGFTASCPSSGIITYTYSPTLSAISGQDFGFNCSASATYDYALYFSRILRGATSSGPSYINLYAANTSCHTGTSTVTLNVSPKYNITSSGVTPTPTSISGNTITWTLTGLSIGYRLLYVPLTPKSTTNNGDTACNYAIITPLTGDTDPTNNVISQCDSVRASWDPNEKSVSPNGPVSAGTTLNYTIDFENLGNDTAFNIHVQDTLSSSLDASSFKLLGSTHRVIPYVYQIAGANVVKFDFPNIKLEDKTVPTRNKGQVRFSMKLKSGLPVGTVIRNRAGIYFDGNPVVLTNYAFSRIPVPAGVEPFGLGSGLSVYPNPAYDVLTIDVKAGSWNEVVLSNAIGQVVRKMPLMNGANRMDIRALPVGIYYLRASGDAGSKTEKIVKQ